MDYAAHPSAKRNIFSDLIGPVSQRFPKTDEKNFARIGTIERGKRKSRGESRR
jgi:hypothetical protein